MNDILPALLEHGAIGIVAAIAVIAAWQKDKQVTKVYETLVSKMESVAATNRQVAIEMEAVIRRLESRLSGKRGRSDDS